MRASLCLRARLRIIVVTESDGVTQRRKYSRQQHRPYRDCNIRPKCCLHSSSLQPHMHAPAECSCSSQMKAKGARKHCVTILSRLLILSSHACAQSLGRSQRGSESEVKDEGDMVNRLCVTNLTIFSTHLAQGKTAATSVSTNGNGDDQYLPRYFNHIDIYEYVQHALPIACVASSHQRLWFQIWLHTCA